MLAVPAVAMRDAGMVAMMWLWSYICEGTGVPFHRTTLPGTSTILQNAVSVKPCVPAEMEAGVSVPRTGVVLYVLMAMAFEGVTLGRFSTVTFCEPGPGIWENVASNEDWLWKSVLPATPFTNACASGMKFEPVIVN